MNLTIREADLQTPGDQRMILTLLNDFALEASIAHPLPDDVQTTLIDNLRRHPTTVIYLAEHADQPIGIAVCFVGFSTFANKPLLNIHDFYIRQAYQGQGFGTMFLNQIEQRARERGCCKVTLEVYARNARAKALYERQGYQGSQPEDSDQIVYALSKKL